MQTNFGKNEKEDAVGSIVNGDRTDEPARGEYERLVAGAWRPVMTDACTSDWRTHWFLDGENATISHSPSGMDFAAGPTFGLDADHAVLWTRQEFSGDVKIDYEFTRLDHEHRCVTILYIQATGSGEGVYTKDIAEWSHLRRVPAMKEYFGHMFTYHISYAAFTNDETKDPGYIRARRYMAGALAGTELHPDYDPAGLFAPGVPHRICAIKADDQIYFRIENDRTVRLCRWRTTTFPPITEGRIGLRHMFTRSARYANVRIAAR